MAEPELVVAVMYPPQWDPPADQLAGYLRDVAAVSPRIRIVDERYSEPGELRLQRGQNPLADLRDMAPELTSRQREVLAEAEVVLAQDLPFDVAQLAPRLRWVQGVGAGVSQLVSAGLPTSRVRLTTAAGVNSVAIAEFVLARILQIAKRFPEIDRLQVSRVWQPAYGSQLAGRHLTVIGLGAIGRRVARLGRAFGMTVTGVRRSAVVGNVDPDVDLRLGPSSGLDAAVGAADYVVAAVPETPENQDMFDAKFFAAMPAGAVFVNVGRGSAVVEDDLVAALSNHLRAAALDVVRQEPLPADSPLWGVPNLLISPHSAAAPDQHWNNVFALFADNLRRYLRGEPLLNEWTAADTLNGSPQPFLGSRRNHADDVAGRRRAVPERGATSVRPFASDPSHAAPLGRPTIQPSKRGSPMTTAQQFHLPPSEGFVVTHFLVVSDQDRSRDYYTTVFGAQVMRDRDPVILQLANTWLILNDGGGPTADKPTVTLTTPPDPDTVSAFLNIRVADIDASQREWTARGAHFLTDPVEHPSEFRSYIRDPDGHLIEVGQSRIT